MLRQLILQSSFSALGLALLTSPLQADILLLKDGRVIDGPTMERGEEHCTVHFKNGDVLVPNGWIEDLFLTADLEGLPKNRRRSLEKQGQERLEQIEEALAHAEWGQAYEDETTNFRWKYTLPKRVAEMFQDRLESYYKIFAKEWRVKRDKRKAKMMINFFANRKEFMRTSGAGGGALAYFMFLGDYDLCCFYDRLDMTSTEMVLYHEASHYLQKLLNEDFKMPHWPGEGIAEYYGGALWDPQKKVLNVGLVQEGRLTEVKNDISSGELLTVEQIVLKDAYTDYTWGWALIHFFMNDKALKKGFLKYANGLANDKKVNRQRGSFNLLMVTPEESLRYLRECMKLNEDSDLEDLTKRFHTYIEEELVIEGAAGLEKAGMGAVQAGKRIRARRLFSEANAAGGLSAVGCYQYAKIVRSSDKNLARDLYRQATELAPLTGTYWYEYGRLHTDEDEGKRLKALGMELDPEVGAYDIDFEDTDD